MLIRNHPVGSLGWKWRFPLPPPPYFTSTHWLLHVCIRAGVKGMFVQLESERFHTREKPHASLMAHWGTPRGKSSCYVSCCLAELWGPFKAEHSPFRAWRSFRKVTSPHKTLSLHMPQRWLCLWNVKILQSRNLLFSITSVLNYPDNSCCNGWKRARKDLFLFCFFEDVEALYRRLHQGRFDGWLRTCKAVEIDT